MEASDEDFVMKKVRFVLQFVKIQLISNTRTRKRIKWFFIVSVSLAEACCGEELVKVMVNDIEQYIESILN